MASSEPSDSALLTPGTAWVLSLLFGVLAVCSSVGFAASLGAGWTVTSLITFVFTVLFAASGLVVGNFSASTEETESKNSSGEP